MAGTLKMKAAVPKKTILPDLRKKTPWAPGLPISAHLTAPREAEKRGNDVLSFGRNPETKPPAFAQNRA